MNKKTRIELLRNIGKLDALLGMPCRNGDSLPHQCHLDFDLWQTYVAGYSAGEKLHIDARDDKNLFFGFGFDAADVTVRVTRNTKNV